jgi:hypothetical protein
MVIRSTTHHEGFIGREKHDEGFDCLRLDPRTREMIILRAAKVVPGYSCGGLVTSSSRKKRVQSFRSDPRLPPRVAAPGPT